MTEEKVKKLQKLGFSRWTKSGYDRLYINETLKEEIERIMMEGKQ